ncbi:MAG: DNA-protecting protein DprA, partial [Gammaproteobacteria bacterium]|nr:DNA-protecting protein DprA [Gammaproteobacteria bacterium]
MLQKPTSSADIDELAHLCLRINSASGHSTKILFGLFTLMPPAEVAGQCAAAIAERLEQTVRDLDAKLYKKCRSAEIGREADRIVSLLRQSDIRLLHPYSRHYPAMLQEIPDRPLVLFVRGNLDCLRSVQIAIVGSRRASPPAQRLASSLAQQLSEAGVVVTSGLARGCDIAAHRGTLEAIEAAAEATAEAATADAIAATDANTELSTAAATAANTVVATDANAEADSTDSTDSIADAMEGGLFAAATMNATAILTNNGAIETNISSAEVGTAENDTIKGDIVKAKIIETTTTGNFAPTNASAVQLVSTRRTARKTASKETADGADTNGSAGVAGVADGTSGAVGAGVAGSDAGEVGSAGVAGGAGDVVGAGVADCDAGGVGSAGVAGNVGVAGGAGDVVGVVGGGVAGGASEAGEVGGAGEVGEVGEVGGAGDVVGVVGGGVAGGASEAGEAGEAGGAGEVGGAGDVVGVV